jgi:hypothetical protein
MPVPKILGSEDADAWHSVRDELDCWVNSGLKAKFWVRDDDAIEPSEQLMRLRSLAASHDIRVGLAVIPGCVSRDLIKFLDRNAPQFYPMCHGWKHVNYNLKKRPAEFGPDRPISGLVSDAKSAFRVFSELFGSARAIFVPPFNRVTPTLIKSLPDIGFLGVSLMPNYFERKILQVGSRLNYNMPIKIPDFNVGPRIDVHIDVINWRARTAREIPAIANELVQHLRVRRLGFLRADAPIGLLTHHLVHDERIWRLCRDILGTLQSHQAVEFLDIARWTDAVCGQSS